MKYSIYKNIACTALLGFPMLSYGAIAYIPTELKQCINMIRGITPSCNVSSNLEDLCAIIQEGRMLMSQDTMYEAVQEALLLMNTHRTQFDDEQRKTVKQYLRRYLDSLDEKHLLLTPHSETGKTIAWPMSLVTRSLDDRAALDMIYLSNELLLTKNIAISGDISGKNTIDVIKRKHYRGSHHHNHKQNKQDPVVIFNASTMNNSISTTPTIVFGTGVSSPSLNAWIMTPSTTTQSPINIEFGVPADLKTKKDISLELHFLIQQNGTPAGNARMQVNGAYIGQDGTFNIFSSTPTFTTTNDSHDFLITEPTSSNSLKHIAVTISLDKDAIMNHQLVLYSITRIAPQDGTEYDNNIYLAAASFIYTAK